MEPLGKLGVSALHLESGYGDDVFPYWEKVNAYLSSYLQTLSWQLNLVSSFETLSIKTDRSRSNPISA